MNKRQFIGGLVIAFILIGVGVYIAIQGIFSNDVGSITAGITIDVFASFFAGMVIFNNGKKGR